MTIAKLAVGLAAVIVWGFGVRTEDSRIRWAGIALLVVALALRFVKRRPRP
ncbi:MAG: hypothetical protein MUF00_09545 [Gemmatimonadaceae bacterium]|jgi:hypothetical protein|nr:hypothetical protein [Gemmatimonadaceae bacterium]